jgi:uncharacterized membrane protein
MSRHPLHPALVHFPIACWSLAMATDVAGLWLGEVAWQWSGGLLAVGCGMALVAMLAGLVELARVPEGPAMRVAYWHMGAMLCAGMLFGARLLSRLDGLHSLAPNTASLLLDTAGFICLGLGGWLGGRLVYEYGVGRADRQAS